MSVFICILTILNVAAFSIGCTINGVVWFMALLMGFVTCALLHCKSCLCLIPLGLGIVLGGYAIFMLTFIIAFIDYLSIYYIILKEKM